MKPRFYIGGGNDDYEIDAVVVGLDTEFNYRKLCIANVLLQRYPYASLIATNEDAYDLVGPDSRHLPGNGALVKALEYCSGRNAINVGKPSKFLAELMMVEHSLDPQRTLFVGDRLDTDCKFGIDNYMKSAIVLTGCTTAQKLIDVGEGTHGIRASQDGTKVYVSITTTNEIQIIDSKTLDIIDTVQTGNTPFWISIPGNQ